MSEVRVVREWDLDGFHRRVLELEAQGYVARQETYRILADVHPDTGVVSHLYTIEMCRPDPKRSQT